MACAVAVRSSRSTANATDAEIQPKSVQFLHGAQYRERGCQHCQKKREVRKCQQPVLQPGPNGHARSDFED